MNIRWTNMVEKYGSEEGATQEMRRRSALSKRNKEGKGGFADLKRDNPELFKELTRKGGKNRAKNSQTKSEG